MVWQCSKSWLVLCKLCDATILLWQVSEVL
ncbi:hypothetical protein E2C01_009191 [Portunus trituberculatus]|uniref:Uncharacterized protein n=1 Tax=Portunus trituberculatus TaxID=210409 RepID=A0A5B7D2T5_PORTR|nr:hypothetical protein [Portunus trituberculatus]